ncbi:hypothetical protein N8T08_000477 [Aspergillus melleus]|uniref:Uncharacterized protein n=1 Tax=Aspergillus melleus TaxID=138277 RepID=A0ACC3BBH8_9EURO|nr:hypothetical protein N8T08_000477 [Aspergillus melleus]
MELRPVHTLCLRPAWRFHTMEPIVTCVRHRSRALFSHVFHLNRGYTRITPQSSSLLSRTLRPLSSSVRAAATTIPYHKSTPYLGIAARGVSTMASEPQFAEGIDVEQLRPRVDALVGNGWKLDEDGTGVLKTYYFKTYFKAVSFVNVVASQSAAEKHHPTMTVRIGSVDVHWTTHRPRGLTDKDLTMAQHCDEAAEMMGSVDQDKGKKCG